MTQTTSVSRVAITILTVLANHDRKRLVTSECVDAAQGTPLGLEVFLARILKRESRNFGRPKQNFSQRPTTLPTASAPK